MLNEHVLKDHMCSAGRNISLPFSSAARFLEPHLTSTTEIL